VLAAYGHVPLSFEPNVGQSDSRVRFLARGPGSTLFLTPRAAVLALAGKKGSPKQALQLQFPGAADPVLRAGPRLPGEANYFLGTGRSRWHTGVSTYASVHYAHLWPGIDASFYGVGSRLEYDLRLAPGANPSRIALRFSGGRAEQIDAGGDLVVTLRGGARARQLAPFAYQLVGGKRREVVSRFVLARGVARIVLGGYNHRLALTVDPVLVYSTYLGGSGNDVGTAVAVDSAGEAFVTGYTTSTNFPTQNPDQSANGGGSSDAFVTKLNAAGSAVDYSTYLGGNGNDSGHGIALDSAGDAYITGYTQSTNFPTQNPEQSTNKLGYGDAFVTKLNPSGSALIYSTYLGDTSDDAGYGIAVNSNGEAYVTGYTSSTGFPTTLNSEQPAFGGGFSDAFVTKLNAAGNALLYSTYLGGSDRDAGNAIALDSAGDALVTGFTQSTNFPTHNPLQANKGSGFADAFVTELKADGSGLVYSTYLGGSGNDSGNGIAVESNGNAYVAGQTTGSFPLQRPEQPVFGGGSSDGFVAKLNPAGSALVYSTYLGGSGDDFASGVAVDSAGDAYVVGSTNSTDFPSQSAAQPASGGGFDAVVTKLNPPGSAPVFSTYLGGSSDDDGLGIAVDALGGAYITGYTQSTNFPTQNPLQPTSGSGQDAFLTKLSPPDTTPPTSTAAVATCLSPVTVTVSDEPHGSGPRAVHFRIDGGPEQVIATTGDPGTAAVPIPEGNQALEYWGEDGAGNLEAPHHVVSVQVDTTPPTVSISSDQGFSSYEIGDKATVTVRAADAVSGLAADPSRSHAPASTAQPGRFTLSISATDHCANSASASFSYKVITSPVFAKTVNLESVAGTVSVGPAGVAAFTPQVAPASAAFATLIGARQVPLGAIVEATAGTVRVTTATGGRRRLQSAVVGGGRFKILQPRSGRGLAELVLIDSRVRRGCTRTSARTIRVLRADAKGRFRTSGTYATATLRGTMGSWSISDRCDGTLTHVTRGSVTVHDPRARKAVVVRTGASYLARAA
jgi:hypothetical protein